MPTGYEVKMYQDISRATIALEKIAKAVTTIANALEEQQRPAAFSGKKSAQYVTTRGKID